MILINREDTKLSIKNCVIFRSNLIFLCFYMNRKRS